MTTKPPLTAEEIKTLLARAAATLARVSKREALIRIPAHPEDADLVISALIHALSNLAAERDCLRSAVDQITVQCGNALAKWNETELELERLIATVVSFHNQKLVARRPSSGERKPESGEDRA